MKTTVLSYYNQCGIRSHPSYDVEFKAKLIDRPTTAVTVNRVKTEYITAPEVSKAQ